MTARDVAFSLTILKAKGHPLIVQQMRDFVAAEAIDDATVVVTFAKDRARDVPLYVAGLPMFSKTYYAKRPFDESTLDIPLGSGPYKVGKFEVEPLHRIRRASGIGGGATCRCAEAPTISIPVRFDFYRDRDVAFEGFTAEATCTVRKLPPASGIHATISRR